MSDPIAPATPPAASGGIDMVALNKGIATAVATAVGEAVKPIAEALSKLQAAPAPAPTPAAKADEPKPVTAEDVKAIVAQVVQGQQASAQLQAQRQAFLADKLKGVPAAYAERLGTDPAKWAVEEQAIRSQLQTDLKALGVEPKPVGGEPQGGTPPQPQPDLSKLSAAECVKIGMERLRKQSGLTPPVAPAAPGQPAPAPAPAPAPVPAPAPAPAK